MKDPFYNPNIKDTFSNSIKIENLIQKLNAKDIEVILYMPPLHIGYLEVIDFNKKIKALEKFKIDLANVPPFYDFLYADEVTVVPVKPDIKNFFEISHSTYFAGEMVLDKIFANKGDFGVLVTSKNVFHHNREKRVQFKNWQQVGWYSLI